MKKENDVYEKMLKNPKAMRAAIAEFIKRGSLSLSRNPDELDDIQITQAFIKIWENAKIGGPINSVIDI